MTPDQLEAMIAKKLTPKHRKALDWATYTAVLAGATPAQQEALLNMHRNNQGAKAGEAVQKALNKVFAAGAVTEAAAMMADDNLSTAELLRIYG